MKYAARLAMLTALVGCGDANSTDPTAAKEAFLKSYAEDFLRPTVVDLKSKVDALNTAVIAYRVAPDETTRLAARNAWKDLRRSVKRMELLHFGPAIQRRSKEHLDEWPVDSEEMTKVIDEASEDALTEDFVRNLDYRQHHTGLPAVGYLLFEEALTSKQCAYLKAASAYSRTVATQVHDDWLMGSAPLIEELKSPKTTNGYYTFQTVALQHVVANGLNYAANEISMMKLANAVATPVKSSESEFSGDSRHELMLLLDGMREVQEELSTVLVAINTTTAQSLDQRMDDLAACVQGLPNAPLETTAAVEGGKEKIQACLAKATALTQTISTGVIGVLGLQSSGVESDND